MRRVLPLLVLLLACAGVLRLVALDAQLPHTRDSDSLVVGQALHIEKVFAGEAEELQLSPLYPHLIPWMLALLPGPLERSAEPDAPLAEHLVAASHPDLLARRLIALLSWLAVPATFVLARRMLPVGWALVAAAFVATSLLHLLYGRMARPHGPMASFALWTIVALPWALRTGGAWRIGVCGVLAGLTVGCLHSGLAVLPACTLACVFLAMDRGPRALWKAGIPAACLLLSLLLFYPFLFATEQGGLFADRPFEEDALGGQGFERIFWTFRAHDPVLGSLALLGLLPLLVHALRSGKFWQHERGRAALLTAAHALPYALAIGLYYQNWHRFSIVLVPYAALLAALALATLTRLAPRVARAPGAVLLTVAALALPSYAAGRFLWLQRQPDVYDHVAAWVEEHVARDETCVVSNLLSLPIEQDIDTAGRSPRWMRSPWQSYILRVEPRWRDGGYALRMLYVRPERSDDAHRVTLDDVGKILDQADAKWAFVVTPAGPRARYDDTPAAVVAAGGVLVKRFRLFETTQLLGDRGGRDHFGDEALPFALWSRGMGPSIDVFQLKE